MARLKKRKITVKNGVFGQFKFTESYTSLILGAIVVLIVGILFIFFARGNRNMQTSSTDSTRDVSQIEKPQEQSKTSSTYTVKPGDDLWSISENVYNDGYKWIEIAKANKIENPGLINVGNKLTIPKVEKKSVVMKSDKVVENNSITGNTYIIVSGDNLWDICVRAYGDGFRWVELAKVNNILNPDLIYSDNVLKIPR